MDKQAFKQRMQNLKSYRENNPGKGYWDWKVQAYQNGGDIPLWQQYQYSGPSYQDVLDDLKQNNPSTYNQLQQSKAADSQSSSEVVRYVDSEGRLQSTSNLQGLSPVITSDYLPGVGDAMEVTQIVQDVKNEDYGAALAGLGLLALPGNWLSKIKSKYGKKGLVNSIYNNVAPGSYYDSYIPGGSKKDELKGALKDYLLGKGDKIDPKWENWINSPTTLGSFIAKDNKKQQHMLDVMTAARKEAWQNYLGIPHDDRYLINTGIKENGMPVYRSNVTDVPNVQLRDIAKTTQHKPENTPYVHGDMINSTGGNISVKYRDNGDLRTITTEDIWDLNPFKDANRARILPEWLKNKYMHIEVQPDGYQKRVWNDNAPKWLVDLEPANLLGIPGPFLNRTTFNARLLNKDQAVKKVPISKEEYVNKRFGTELELIDPSEMTDKEFQKWKKLTQNRYSEEYDRLNEQQSERLFEFVPKTEEELLDKYGIYVKKYSDGGEVSEFQRKTRRDIMQESLVDGRPDYNKMFQNQNEYQKDFANYWYTERAKNPKYSDQIGGDKLSSVLSNVNKATWKTPTEAMRDNMVGQGYNPTDAQINQQLNILKEKGTKGFANPKAHSYTSLRPTNTWHEGIGHMVGDNTPAILNATPNVRISNPDSSYEDYVNQANEKHAQTWDFRGNNSNLKDDQGNYYIDPNRQLTPEDISNMRSKGAKIPEQWESLEDADISELTNTFAYNMYQDPVQYMANGGEIGDEEIKYLSNWYNKRRTYAKHRIPAMNKQLDRIDYYLKPSKYRKTIYDTPVTISNDKVKQASDKDDRGEYGGYYHPNEGVVLPDNYKEWKDREPLLHELNHVVNTFNLPVFNQINSILKDKQIIDRGDKVNQYLTTPSEVQSRLMEFRKLNNLDPLKVYGIPDVREWRRSGKDANLLDTFDDDTVLELINTVASNNVSDSIQKVAEGGEIGDPDDEFTKAINTKLGRTPDGRPLQQGLKPVFDLEDAANLTPVGDVLSAKEAYDAVKQNDWLGAGLAGLGFIPFIPKGVRRIARQTPTVNRTFEQKVAEMEKRVSNRRKMMEEFYDQRNRTYELLNTPEARRRAADIDQK